MEPRNPESPPIGLICAQCQQPVSRERLRLLLAHTGEWFGCETDWCDWVQMRTPHARLEFASEVAARTHEYPLLGPPRQDPAPLGAGSDDNVPQPEPPLRWTHPGVPLPSGPPRPAEQLTVSVPSPPVAHLVSSRPFAGSEDREGKGVPAVAVHRSQPLARPERLMATGGARAILAVVAIALTIGGITAMSAAMQVRSERAGAPSHTTDVAEDFANDELAATADGETDVEIPVGEGDGQGAERVVSGTVRPPTGYRAASLHTWPGTSAPMVTMVPAGASVHLLGETATGGEYRWTRVRTAQGQEGWLIASALRPE